MQTGRGLDVGIGHPSHRDYRHTLVQVPLVPEQHLGVGLEFHSVNRLSPCFIRPRQIL
jgi:hypothetical protein